MRGKIFAAAGINQVWTIQRRQFHLAVGSADAAFVADTFECQRTSTTPRTPPSYSIITVALSSTA